MRVTGADILHRLAAGEISEAKLVFNSAGVIALPIAVQHRDAKADGISYEDNYRGNALAAIIRRDHIEIRFHERFRDQDVANLVSDMLRTPQFEFMLPARVTYQGRDLRISA